MRGSLIKLRHVRTDKPKSETFGSAARASIQQQGVNHANDPKSDKEQGRHDTEGRPVVKKTQETKRQEKQGSEDANDPDEVGKS